MEEEAMATEMTTTEEEAREEEAAVAMDLNKEETTVMMIEEAEVAMASKVDVMTTVEEDDVTIMVVVEAVAMTMADEVVGEMTTEVEVGVMTTEVVEEEEADEMTMVGKEGVVTITEDGVGVVDGEMMAMEVAQEDTAAAAVEAMAAAVVATTSILTKQCSMRSDIMAGQEAQTCFNKPCHICNKEVASLVKSMKIDCNKLTINSTIRVVVVSSIHLTVWAQVQQW